jgi:hypothetical protein
MSAAVAADYEGYYEGAEFRFVCNMLWYKPNLYQCAKECACCEIDRVT